MWIKKKTETKTEVWSKQAAWLEWVAAAVVGEQGAGVNGRGRAGCGST